ncbi:signal peptidase II [Mesomycoplasma molare]|uniref:Signal peptidase II n=1 Tax=Mesomycoplasma molare TaxID=171288 RepID=A0ABY5TUA2_9BACT|nr:signal peptidase II [Mesomycoplasma molare]UWD34247.1 signal peptidase II [Mesomycoplasma molare]
MNEVKKHFFQWLNHLKNFPKKKLLLNSIISFSLILTFVLIDQLTKNLIFDHKEFTVFSNWKERNVILDFKIIGFRPLLHIGVTSGINKYIGFFFIHLFSLIIVLVLPYFMIFSKRKLTIIILAFLWSGTFGNMLDRFLYENGVKDVFYIPWYDNGTFNFADVLIVLGSIGGALIILYTSFIESYILKKKNNKEHKE